MIDEKTKEETLRGALNTVLQSQEDIKKQVATLSVAVVECRDLLIHEIHDWCENHLRTLQGLADTQNETLVAQKDKLQTQVDALSSHQRNILGTVNAAKDPVELVPVILRLLEKVREHVACIDKSSAHVISYMGISRGTQLRHQQPCHILTTKAHLHVIAG